MTSNSDIGHLKAALWAAGLLSGLVSPLALACTDGMFFDRFDEQRPWLYGLDLDDDGQAEIVNQGGCLLPQLEWVKGFPVTVAIDGDADEYSANLGKVSGNEWTFESDTSGPYTLAGHRGGLEDSSSGQLDLRVARVTHLGGAPVQASGSEWIVEKELPCGEAYSGSFATNTGDLVPSITASFEAASTLPAGSSLTPEGVFTFTPSCSAGSPLNVIFAVDSEIDSQGNHLGLEQILADINIAGVDPGGPPPQVFGLDATFDGSVEYFVIDDEGQLLIPPIEYICGRLREMRIVGDADSYELIDAPDDMSVDGDILSYHPDWDAPGCTDSPNGLETTLTLRAHGNGQTTDIEKTAWAMDPRIDCVTHYPGIPAGGGEQPKPKIYCRNSGSGSIAEIIELSYNIATQHEIHVHVRPSLKNYTPHRAYEFEGNNIPGFMSFNLVTGVITASPIATDADFYFTTVKAANGGKQTGWVGIDYQVVE